MGSTTGSFERVKSSRLNRSQSSRTRLVGERRVVSIDNGGGIVKSRPGTHCAYPLTTSDYRPRTSRFLGSGIILRSHESTGYPYACRNSSAESGAQFENLEFRF